MQTDLDVASPGPGTPGVGVAGFVLAIAGLCVPFVGIVGLVLSVVGNRQAKREGLRRGSRSPAS